MKHNLFSASFPLFIILTPRPAPWQLVFLMKCWPLIHTFSFCTLDIFLLKLLSWLMLLTWESFIIIWFENWFGSFISWQQSSVSLCTHSNKLSGKQAFSMSLTLIIVSTTKMFFKSLVGKLIIIILLQLMQWINSLGKCLFNTKETKNF